MMIYSYLVGVLSMVPLVLIVYISYFSSNVWISLCTRIRILFSSCVIRINETRIRDTPQNPMNSPLFPLHIGEAARHIPNPTFF